MRYFFLLVMAAVAVIVSPGSRTDAVPGAGGVVLFSTQGIGPAHDVSAAVSVPFGLTCTSADLMTAPMPIIPACMPRLGPPGPVPDSISEAVADLGLNTGGPFTDDLDAMSFGDELGTAAVLDYDFSVGPSPANGGVTTGAPVPAVCFGASLINVTSETALLEGHGDIFTWPGAPLIAPCNMQTTDEAALGLIAPNPAAPGIPPLDNVDVLAEFVGGGPCTLTAGTTPVGCSAFSVTGGSAVLGGIAPDPVTLAMVSGATVLAPPGTPAAPPALPAGCPGPLPCAAVGFPSMGLVAGDDIDALCWYDVLANGVPNLPIGAIGPGSPGDIYQISLTPGSPSAPGFGGPAAIITVGGGTPPVPIPPFGMGLLATDDIDGLICHHPDADTDGIPDLLDLCPLALPWSVPAGDDDCDGFPSAALAGGRGSEAYIGTIAADDCPANAGQNNEAVDAWPPDFNDDQRVNLSDVVAIAPWFNQIGPNPPNLLYNRRFDLNQTVSVNLGDIVMLGAFYNLMCTP